MFFIKKNNYSSKQIIDNIKHRKNYEKTIRELYNLYYDKVKVLILKLNGTKEDAEDIFQDAIAKVIWSIDKDQFKGEAHISTYLFTISKNMWLSTLKKRNRYDVSYDNVKVDGSVENDSDFTSELPLAEGDDLDTKHRFRELLNKIGEDCQRLLTYFYFQQLTYEEILKKFDGKYTSEKFIRNKKSRCINYLRKGLENSTEKISDLLDNISECLDKK